MVSRRDKVRAQERAIKAGYISAALVALVHITATAAADVVWGQSLYGDPLWYALVALGALLPMFVAPIAGVLRYRHLVGLAEARLARRADHVTHETIEEMVARFYDKVMQDRRLKPIFEAQIGPLGPLWRPHMALMNRFWRSVLLGEAVFKGTPMEKHARIPQLGPEDFKIWLMLFRETVDEIHQKPAADAVYAKAARIAASLEMGYAFHNQRLAA